MRLKEWECIQEISEEIAYEKKVLRDMRAKLDELERCFQWKTAESEKEVSVQGDEQQQPKTLALTGRLSLQSPYPTTTGPDIARYPLAKRYILWSVPFPAYEPPYYSQPVEHFDVDSRPFVDEDVIPKQHDQLPFKDKRSYSTAHHFSPSFKWNDLEYSVSRSGSVVGARAASGSILIDRRCWPTADGEFTTTSDENRSLRWTSAASANPSSPVVIEYQLEVGTQLPLNPHGRTGVRGRGANRRWGPNHHLLLAIVHSSKDNRGQCRLLLERNEHSKLRLIEVN